MSNKELIVVGGANGSGKTTFAEEYVAAHGCKYLGADLIAAELSPDDPASASFAAGRAFSAKVEAAIAEAKTFVLESTLAGRTLRNALRRSRAQGFSISMIYMYLDSPDTCVARVAQRVRKGGHHVPEVDVRRRYARNVLNFWSVYRNLADRWVLIENSGHRPLDIAIGTPRTQSIRDERMFQHFLDQQNQPVGTNELDAISVFQKTDAFIRIFRSAVRKAQAESRRLGAPNVYSFEGTHCYELPNGDLVQAPPGMDCRP